MLAIARQGFAAGVLEQSLLAEVALFRAFAGREEFNPLGILVPPEGRRVHVVRFWRAFRDHKHGKPRLLQPAEADLERLMGAIGDAPAR